MTILFVDNIYIFWINFFYLYMYFMNLTYYKKYICFIFVKFAKKFNKGKILYKIFKELQKFMTSTHTEKYISYPSVFYVTHILL